MVYYRNDVLRPLAKPSGNMFHNASLGASTFVLTTIVAFSCYANTASKSIAGGDSGELVAEGCALGTAHPPGYPLYTIIVYLVTTLGKYFVPSQAPAYLINLTSCLFGSLSSGFVALVVYRLAEVSKPSTRDQCSLLACSRCSAALLAGLFNAFSPLMWQYNTSAEVFALNNLFVSLIVYVMVIHSIQPDSRAIIAAGSFLCGLALTNQHTSILLIVPVVVWVFYNSSMLTKPKLFALSSASFVAGISFYALLPLLAIKYPHAGSWGNVTSFSGFVHHFLRRDYGTLRLYSGSDAPSEGMAARTSSWARDFATEQLGIESLLLIPLLGFASGWCLFRNVPRMWCSHATKGQRKRLSSKKKGGSHRPQANDDPSNAVLKVIACSLLFYLGVFHSLSNLPLDNSLLYGIHQRFWMHPNILCFILIGIIVHKSIVIISFGYSSNDDFTLTAVAPRSTQWRLVTLTILVLLLPFAAYQRNYERSDQSSNNYFRNYALSILEPLPANSLLLSNYDQQWTSIRYMQECEGVRRDVTSINPSMMTFEWWKTKRVLYGNVSFPGTHYTKENTLPWLNGGFTFFEFIDANVEEFGSNIFIGGHYNFEDSLFDKKYEEEPFGLVRKIRPASAVVSAESFRSKSLLAWKNIARHLSCDLPRKDKYPPSTWESTINMEFFHHLVSRATYLLDLALKENERTTKTTAAGVLPSIAEAAAWLEFASAWENDLAQQSSMKKNLGLAYMNIVRSKESGGFPYVEDIFGVNTNGTWIDKGTTGGICEGLRKHYSRNWWTKSNKVGDGDWKGWATTRWREEWEMFLGLEPSKADPSYAQIKSIYTAVMKSSQAKTK